jgi:hypothetical protein
MFERAANVVPRCGWSPEEPKHDTGRPLLAFRAMRTNSGTSYHALPAAGHPWIRAICGAAPGSRSAGWTVAGGEVTCPHCRQMARITAAISSSC